MKTDCPDENTILAFAQGKGPPTQHQALEAHLDQCAACRKVVADLVAGGLLGRPAPSLQPGTLPDPARASSAQPPALGRGTVVGRYVLLDRLGQGGMGVVWSAYDPELDRRVAIKLVRRDSAPGDQERPGRLQREGQALARLSHPNVVPVFDVGAHEGQLFVAMEQVDGWTLERWLQAEPRTVGQILEVFEAAGQGLAAAHRAGLIHRDFKPANVMVGRDGRVRVTDFGLARLAEGPEPAGQAPRPPAEGALTQTGAQLGTPAFMAPEQIRGEPVSAATDQFAFCVALYQALFGAHPFLWEPGQGTQALWQAVVEGRLREVPRRRSLPGRARVALQRGLSPDPGARNPGMEALLAAVRPAPRLRRLVLAASLAAAGLAAAAGLGLRAWVTSQERAAAELCERAAGKIEQSLGPERRSALAALLAKASPGAERRAAAALEGLERWAGRWEDGYRDACLASSVRHEQSPEVMLLRTQCLDTRLREFDQVVLAFLEGDPALLGQAPQVVARLTGLDSCGDTVALRAPLQPAAELAPAVARARERLADVLAMYKTARVDQALPLARETLEQARGLGFRPLQAEAGQALAKLLFAKADYAAQEATLRRALADALAGRHDALAVEILADLGYLLGPARNEYQQAQDVFELAQALLDRLGGVGYLQMFVDNNQAASFMAQGKHAEAEAVLTRLRAAKLRAEQGQAVHSLHLGRIDTNLGAALVGQRKFEAALPLYQEARTVMEQNLGPDHPDLAVVQNNLIEPLFELGRKDEARRVAEEVLAARIRALGADHPQTNTTRFNLASLLIDAGQYPQARAVLEESLVHYRTRFGPDHVAAADALSALGSVLLAQGEPAGALEVLERSLALRTRAGEEPLLGANTRFSLAKALAALGRDRPRVRALAEQARELYLAAGAGYQDQAGEISTWLSGLRARGPR